MSGFPWALVAGVPFAAVTAKARGLAFILRGPNLEAAAQEPCGIPLSIEVFQTCYWVRVVANSHPPSSPGDHSDQYTSEQRGFTLSRSWAGWGAHEKLYYSRQDEPGAPAYSVAHTTSLPGPSSHRLHNLFLFELF